MNVSDLLSPLLPPLLNLPVLDLLLIGLAATALIGWLLGVLVALFFMLTRRCRMIGSPPWWAILAFGLATAALLPRQYLNGAMAATGDGAKWAGFAVVGVLCILYALRRGQSVQFRLFGEYGGGGSTVVSAASRIPASRLLLHSLFWGIVLWTLSRMIPHAAGREVLLLTLLLFAGTFPFASRMSLLDWSLKSETERDRNRGLLFLFCGGGLLLVSLNPDRLIPDHLVAPNRWVYLLAGLICLLIGLDYRGSGLHRLLASDAPAPGQDGFSVLQTAKAPLRRSAVEAKTEPLVAMAVAIRSRATARQTSRVAEPTQQPDAWEDENEAEEDDSWQDEEQADAADEAPPQAARSRFWLLYLVLGMGLLLYAVPLWLNFFAQEHGIDEPISLQGLFTGLVTVIGIKFIGRAFGRPWGNFDGD